MRILGILGSLQRKSYNRSLLVTIGNLMPAGSHFTIYDGLAQLPHFNSDLNTDPLPPEVTRFRSGVALADGLVFATPEYALEMPGALKNALDWLVSSGELTGKPVAVMSASPALTGGIRAQIALVQTLSVLSARIVDTVMVPAVTQKVDGDGFLSDAILRARLEAIVTALSESTAGIAADPDGPSAAGRI